LPASHLNVIRSYFLKLSAFYLLLLVKHLPNNIVDGIKKGIANIRRLTTILNKAKNNKLDVDKKISELEAKIADLKAERKSLYSKPVENLIADRKELRKEIAGTRNETNIAKDVARGLQYAKAILVTSKKGSVGSKAAAKGLKPVPMDISKIVTVVNSKASSTLAFLLVTNIALAYCKPLATSFAILVSFLVPAISLRNSLRSAIKFSTGLLYRDFLSAFKSAILASSSDIFLSTSSLLFLALFSIVVSLLMLAIPFLIPSTILFGKCFTSNSR
jgi:hypothetical protein